MQKKGEENGKNFTCRVCARQFTRASQFQRHRESHRQQKLHRCLECQKVFARPSTLRLHQRIHSGEKPYQCDDCQRRFTDSSTLVRHRRIHTGEKPYACPQCPKRFTQLSSYSYHVKTHHARERPFACHYCDRQFAVNSSLQIHLKVHTEKTARVEDGDASHLTEQAQGGTVASQSDGTEVDMDTVCCLIPSDDVSLADIDKLLEVDACDGPSYQVGSYGATPVTIAFLSTAASVDILSLLQPCSHPNVAMVYGVAVMGGMYPTLLVENVSTSLTPFLSDIGDQLSLRERLDIAMGCVSAVDYLHHQLGVSHGMLTCDYIFLSSVLTARILDPKAVLLLNGRTAQSTMRSDIRQLGQVLQSLFPDDFLGIGSDVPEKFDQSNEPHSLYSILCLMVDEKEESSPSFEEIMSTLESIRQSDEYKQCLSKCELFITSSNLSL